MKCARCHDPELVEGGPLSSWTCPRCGGGLIPDDGLTRLLEELNHTREELHELAKLYGGAREQCPSCRSKMSPLVLRGTQIDLCFGCGSLWVDAGDLEAISRDRHSMPPPTQPLAKATPAVIPAQTLVRVDERALPRHVVRAVLAGVGAVGVVWAAVGIVPPSQGLVSVAALALAAALSRRRAFDVLPRARRMMRWRGFFSPDAKSGDGEPFSPESCVVVRHLRLGTRALGWFVIDLVDLEGRTLARLKGPLAMQRAWTDAPRYARALGVAVRFDIDPKNDDALDAADAKRADLPRVAAPDVMRIEPEQAAKMRRMQVRAGDGTALATVTTDVTLRGKPKNIDEILAEHFVITDAGGLAVRLFSTTQLGVRATVVVGPDGKVLGHVSARRGFLGDTYAFAGPQGRRSARVMLRHGFTEARVTDGYGRVAGVLDVTGAPLPGEARPATLHMFPGRLTGDVRWGMVALLVHASLAATIDEL